MQNMGITEKDVDRRKKFVGLGPDDVARLAAVRDSVIGKADPLTNAFFEHLTTLDEARVLLGYRELTNQARTLKREHLIAMVSGPWDMAYVQQRVRLALLYARAGLDTRVYLGAFQHLLGVMGRQMDFETFLSVQKVAFFDIGIQLDVLVHERERTIRQQSEAIRELSTPVLQIRERLLLLPLIGVIDSHRAQLITENLLKAIRESRAKVIVMDVTGVATIDSKIANHLLQTVSAAKLMGAIVIVTGVSAEVAQSLVAIGIELAEFTTVGDLQGGVEDAERILGYRVVSSET